MPFFISFYVPFTTAMYTFELFSQALFYVTQYFRSINLLWDGDKVNYLDTYILGLKVFQRTDCLFTVSFLWFSGTSVDILCTNCHKEPNKPKMTEWTRMTHIKHPLFMKDTGHEGIVRGTVAFSLSSLCLLFFTVPITSNITAAPWEEKLTIGGLNHQQQSKGEEQFVVKISKGFYTKTPRHRDLFSL